MPGKADAQACAQQRPVQIEVGAGEQVVAAADCENIQVGEAGSQEVQAASEAVGQAKGGQVRAQVAGVGAGIELIGAGFAVEAARGGAIRKDESIRTRTTAQGLDIFPADIEGIDLAAALQYLDLFEGQRVGAGVSAGLVTGQRPAGSRIQAGQGVAGAAANDLIDILEAAADRRYCAGETVGPAQAGQGKAERGGVSREIQRVRAALSVDDPGEGFARAEDEAVGCRAAQQSFDGAEEQADAAAGVSVRRAKGPGRGRVQAAQAVRAAATHQAVDVPEQPVGVVGRAQIKAVHRAEGRHRDSLRRAQSGEGQRISGAAAHEGLETSHGQAVRAGIGQSRQTGQRPVGDGVQAGQGVAGAAANDLIDILEAAADRRYCAGETVGPAQAGQGKAERGGVSREIQRVRAALSVDDPGEGFARAEDEAVGCRAAQQSFDGAEEQADAAAGVSVRRAKGPGRGRVQAAQAVRAAATHQAVDVPEQPVGVVGRAQIKAVHRAEGRHRDSLRRAQSGEGQRISGAAAHEGLETSHGQAVRAGIGQSRQAGQRPAGGRTQAGQGVAGAASQERVDVAEAAADTAGGAIEAAATGRASQINRVIAGAADIREGIAAQAAVNRAAEDDAIRHHEAISAGTALQTLKTVEGQRMRLGCIVAAAIGSEAPGRVTGQTAQAVAGQSRAYQTINVLEAACNGRQAAVETIG